jgi:hypothetical protein
VGAVRGVSRLILVLTLVGGAALLADAWLDLPLLVRRALFSAWFGIGLTAVFTGILRPLFRRHRPENLAAVVEQEHPELNERLSSTVELAEARGLGHGSPALIELLARETEAKSGAVDFPSSVSCRGAVGFGTAAGFVLALALVPAVIAPGAYADRLHRFFFSYSWRVEAPYSFAVTPGEAVAAVGRPLTISVHVRPRNERVPLPTECMLVLTDAAGHESRQRMSAERSDTFSLAYTVKGNFEYRVEAGAAVSETYPVTGVVPVELAAESPAVVVTPPEYARAAWDAETYVGLVDLTALRHSEVRFDFRFTRPALCASLEWVAGELRQGKEGTQSTTRTTRLPLVLSEDRRAASLSLPATATGSYHLVLAAEHDIRTELDGGTLTVKEDEPPQFLKFSGREDLMAVLPYERLPLEVLLADDVDVAGAEVEYRINDGPVQNEAMALEGQNTREARGRHVFALGGKVKEGDEVRYHLRAWDNLPEPLGGPHVVYHPADRWLTLKIASGAQPLREQEILARRDDVDRRLEEIRANLMKEQRAAYKLRQETRRDKALDPERADELKQLRRDNEASENALRELARDTAATPALQPVREGARDVADREMRQAGAALQEAGSKERTPDERDQQLRGADEQLESALKRLDKLQQANERIAQERLDQAKVESLAERQKELAERAAELAKNDPPAKDQLEEVRREQDEVAAELQRLTEQSESLRKTLDEARAEQARTLADRARELAQAQRDLERAQRDAEQKRNAERLAELARKQQELAEQAERLAQQTRKSSAATKTDPFKPEEARKAAAALRLGDPEDAMKHQAQASRDLDRVADDVERATNLAGDPREAARQLARLQQELLDRAGRAAKEKSDDWRAEAEKDEKAVRRGVEQLSVPTGNRDAEQARRDAAEQAGRAAEELAKQKPDDRSLRASMEEAKRQLERLADKLPSLDRRRQQALLAVAEMRRQQEDLAKQVEKAAKDETAPPDRLAKKLAEAARKQAEIAETLSKMDAPNQETSQERAQEALNRALADLMDARREDVAASQKEAKRQLERLEQALQGKKPADEVARDSARPANEEKGQGDKPARPSPQEEARRLAQEQRDLARETKRVQRQADEQPGEAGKKALEQTLEGLARQQDELNRKTSQLLADRAQKSLEQARATMNEAQQALAQKDADRAQQKQADAAQALERLSRQLPAKAPDGARRQPPDGAESSGLPAREQSEEARRLAREQRDLRDAVRQAMEGDRRRDVPAKDNPVGELAREQSEVAKQAADLARQVAREDGEKSSPAQKARQAGQSAKEAADRVQAGALQDAQQSARQSAEQMRELTRQLSQTPRGNADRDAPDALQSARQLTRKQEELNRRLEAAAGNPDAARAQQEARQQDLERQTADLKQDFDRLARQMKQTPPAQQAAEQAARSSRQAEDAMRQAQEQSRQGSQGSAHRAQQEASQSLDRAARRADQAAATPSAARQDPPSQDGPQAGRSLQQAQGKIAEAQGQMAQGQPQDARSSMHQAAQSLQRAAQQLAQGSQQPGRPGQMAPPGEHGAAGGGQVDESVLGPELKEYAGKSWGELPGELRTKIVQDMRARYGEDYARMIKLYFEQIASAYPPATPRPPRASSPLAK